MPSACDQYSRLVSSNRLGEKSGKSKKKISAVVFVFVTVLITLNFLRLTNPSNQQKIKRLKRHTNFAKNRNTQTDIEILPGNRKVYHHPNHRYGDEEPENDKKTGDRLTNRKGWSAQPLQSKHPDSIQDIISKGKFADSRGKERRQVVNELLKGSGSTMRLRGVYVHPESEDGLLGNRLGEMHYDSTEINNLMRNDSEFTGKRSAKRGFKSPGEPFKLPLKGREDPRRQTPNNRSKTRPITIYLDFYPEGHLNEFNRRKPKWNVITPSKNKFRKRFPNQSINFGKFVLPHESPGGIIMKLNLYPKEPISDRQTSHSEHNKRAEKKSFGWFSKSEKKKHPKECSLLGFNPHGNRVTAKWKNEKGEWIHAEHVDIKYLTKENH